MSLNLVTLLYLVASVCFIQALKGLSHPTTSIRGNLFGMIGMAIAVLTTAALIVKLERPHSRGRPGLGAARSGGRRRLRRLARQDGRDDRDARAGGVLPQHDRPGGGVHRGRRRGRAVGVRHRRPAGGQGRSRADPHRQPARAVPRRGDRRDHLQRLGDRLRQALGQVQVPPLPGRAGDFAGQHWLNLVLGLADARPRSSATR